MTRSLWIVVSRLAFIVAVGATVISLAWGAR